MQSWLRPLTRLGLAVAAVTALLDQASKLAILHVLDFGANPPIDVGPFVTLVLKWNTGISYGLFENSGALTQWVLLGIKILAVVLLWLWLTQATGRLTAVSLGLIIGGAVGNGIDRAVYQWAFQAAEPGAVADFVWFHIESSAWRFSWYVFNLADTAIVAGVAGLLYEWIVPGRAAKAP
jgi:signal peptidase II